MANNFEIALVNTGFLDIKDKDLLADLHKADDLCVYINKFLPKQLLGQGQEFEASDEEEDEGALSKDVAPKVFGNTGRAKTIEELYNRIEKLRGKTSNYKERLLKKGLKNRLKKKQKLEERKQRKNATRKVKTEEKDSLNIKEEKKESDDKKPTLIKEDNLQFSKVIVSNSEKSVKTNDPKRILQQVEKKNKKLKKLENKGLKDVVENIKTKETWEMAIKKAEGVKVKDNVELLKKSISKREAQKKRSKKKWEEREKMVKNKKEEAQKKRQENINKKKKERGKKRTKVLVKKGRILPK